MMYSIQQPSKNLVEFNLENSNIDEKDLDNIYIPIFQELVKQYDNNKIILHTLDKNDSKFKINTYFLIKNQEMNQIQIPQKLKGIKKNKKQKSLNKTEKLQYIDGIYDNLTFRVLKLRSLQYCKNKQNKKFQELKKLKDYLLVHTYQKNNNLIQTKLCFKQQQRNDLNSFNGSIQNNFINDQILIKSESNQNHDIKKQDEQKL
ncbi:hypothetical protein ABPG72_016230 [Tetrahymena utriculariae]